MKIHIFIVCYFVISILSIIGCTKKKDIYISTQKSVATKINRPELSEQRSPIQVQTPVVSNRTSTRQLPVKPTTLNAVQVPKSVETTKVPTTNTTTQAPQLPAPVQVITKSGFTQKEQTYYDKANQAYLSLVSLALDGLEIIKREDLSFEQKQQMLIPYENSIKNIDTSFRQTVPPIFIESDKYFDKGFVSFSFLIEYKFDPSIGLDKNTQDSIALGVEYDSTMKAVGFLQQSNSLRRDAQRYANGRE